MACLCFLHFWGKLYCVFKWMGFLGGSVVKNLPANTEDTGSTLGQEDPLDKEIATEFSSFAWEMPKADMDSGSQFMGSQRVRHKLAPK